jgi:hypothetical protein
MLALLLVWCVVSLPAAIAVASLLGGGLPVDQDEHAPAVCRGTSTR